jgi:hypothetical protein
MTTVAAFFGAWILASVIGGLGFIALQFLFQPLDEQDEHARRDMRERLGVGRSVDQFHGRDL